MRESNNADLYNDKNLRESFDTRAAEADRAVSELDSVVGSLPSVESDGKSECPHAEAQYAQKEKKEHRVKVLLAEFQEIVPAIEREMDRALNNLGRIRSVASSLHTEEPRQELSRGEMEAKSAYGRLVRQRERAAIVIEKLSMSLNRSSQKRWPLGKPRESTPGGTGAGLGMPLIRSGRDGQQPPASPSLADEIASIQSMESDAGADRAGSLSKSA